jgi:hypothetical protein
MVNGGGASRITGAATARVMRDDRFDISWGKLWREDLVWDSGKGPPAGGRTLLITVA